jgi:DNA repair ATPase RecN
MNLGEQAVLGYQNLANQLSPSALQSRSLPHALERLEKIVSHLREVEGQLMHTLEKLEAQPSPLNAINKESSGQHPMPPKPNSVLGQFYDALRDADDSLGSIDRYRHEIAKLVTGS